jgi:(p)ppGpp synthase/HD superfamily hydrolase
VVADSDQLPSFLSEPPLAQQAYTLARDAHRRQRRTSDAARFIVHPLEVAALLHNTGHAEHLVVAGILHDTIEDTATTWLDIRASFGRGIAEIVAAMTEDPAIEDFQERKAALRQQIAAFGPEAAAVYAADKVAKVRELRSRATRGENVLDSDNRSGQDKLEHYLASLTMLEQINAQHPLVRQLRFELEILHALPLRPDLLAADRV